MLDLHSPKWAKLKHAYGDASDVPQLIERLRAANSDEWDTVRGELMSAILHQGDVYTATYAAMPHLLELAAELGPSEQSDELLYALAYAARGGVGPQVPEFLEDAWEDAQDEARDLMLDRLISGEASSDYAGLLIAGFLYLSGEWSWAKFVDDWLSGHALKTKCANCGNVKEVFWHDGGPKQSDRDHSSHDIDVTPSTEIAIPPDSSMEFEDDIVRGQLLGLAHSVGHPLVEKQFRFLLGTLTCGSCGSAIELASACE